MSDKDKYLYDIMDKKEPTFLDVSIVYTSGRVWHLACASAEELTKLRQANETLQIKVAALERINRNLKNEIERRYG